jgi:hypothetical protein
MRPGRIKVTLAMAITIIGLGWDISMGPADLSELIEPSKVVEKQKEADIKVVKRGQVEYCPVPLEATDQKQEEEENKDVILDLVTYSAD